MYFLQQFNYINIYASIIIYILVETFPSQDQTKLKETNNHNHPLRFKIHNFLNADFKI